MENKRGVAEGIDWILGVGIFILSITLIFILFKPGVMPIHDKETLLNIVQDGIEDEALWSITEVPIFISPLYDGLYEHTEIIFLSSDGYDLNPDDDIDAPDNNYGEQLYTILGDAGHSNMKLFYITRLIEDRVESFPPFREEHRRGEYTFDEEESDDEESYTSEVGDFCDAARERGEADRERDAGGLCEEGEDGEGRPREEHVIRARSEYVLYVNPPDGSRRSENEPYSDIERENELNFFINDAEILDDEGRIVAEAGDFLMPAYLDNRKTKYVLTVASKPINFAVPGPLVGSDRIPIKVCYAFGGDLSNPFDGIPLPAGIDSIGQLPPDTCFALYELGAKKNITGMHLPSLFALENFDEGSNCETGYGCIKQKWKFPELREFMIEIETIPESSAGERCDDTQQLCYKFPEKKPGPSLNVNTFVRQFNSFLITDDGVKIPIIVRITIW